MGTIWLFNIGKPSISMAIFHSYVSLNQSVNDDSPAIYRLTQWDPGEKPTQIAGIYGCPSMKKMVLY
jgi:hypothetical protein